MLPEGDEEELEQEEKKDDEIAEEAIVIAYATLEQVDVLAVQINAMQLELETLRESANHSHEHEHETKGTAVVPPEEVIIEPVIPHLWQRLPKWF